MISITDVPEKRQTTLMNTNLLTVEIYQPRTEDEARKMHEQFMGGIYILSREIARLMQRESQVQDSPAQPSAVVQIQAAVAA